MAVYLAPTFGAGWQGFTTGGLPLNAGQIFTYAAGTSTPVATFTTSAGNVANSNPIVLGADGRPPSEIWLQSGQAYKFVVEDALSTVIATYDNLTGIGDPLASFIAGNSPALDNILHNGSFPVDQVNNGASVNVAASTSAYTVDRWITTCPSGGSLNVQRINTDTGGGSQYALAFSVATAKPSLAAGDIFAVSERIEGLNTQHLCWGTANAQPVTLQFRFKTNIANAVLPVAFVNGAANRSYVTTFTTGAANTEASYTVTIPGDTSGTWPIDNTASLQILFGFGAGSTFQTGSPNTWLAGNLQSTASATNFMASLANTWQITDVSLVAGSVQLPIQRRSYGQELALCQRYKPVFNSNSTFSFFATGFTVSTTIVRSLCVFPVSTRVPVTSLTSTAASTFSFQTSVSNLVGTGIVVTPVSASLTAGFVDLTVSATTAGVPGMLFFNSASGQLIFTGAEL